MTIGSSPCCGMRELNGLSMNSAEENLRDFARQIQHIDNVSFTHVIFSGVTAERYGQLFADLLERKELGVIVESPSSHNPNSGNRIKAWIWTINRKALGKFLIEHDQKRRRNG